VADDRTGQPEGLLDGLQVEPDLPADELVAGGELALEQPLLGLEPRADAVLVA
jgi:hypothetical protein